VENLNDYSVIFLGYPNWWGTMPMAVFTLLEKCDFSGKTILLF
jgi:flavodoxin